VPQEIHSASPLVGRIERIRGLATDLARELDRPQGHSAGARAIIGAMGHELDAILSTLKRTQR
jgi:hypothetical protein